MVLRILLSEEAQDASEGDRSCAGASSSLFTIKTWDMSHHEAQGHDEQSPGRLQGDLEAIPGGEASKLTGFSFRQPRTLVRMTRECHQHGAEL